MGSTRMGVNGNLCRIPDRFGKHREDYERLHSLLHFGLYNANY